MRTGTDVAARAAVHALSTLVHCPVVQMTASNVLQHFPFSQVSSQRITDAADRGLCGNVGLLDKLSTGVAQAAAACPQCMSQLQSSILQQDDRDVTQHALQVSTVHTACPTFCWCH